MIKLKYFEDNKSFFKYFEKYYINEKKFKIEFWNYTNVINNNINHTIIFFTNNICESFNRTLNKKYIGYCKTMFNFKNCLTDIIKIYEQNSTYKEFQNNEIEYYNYIKGWICAALYYMRCEHFKLGDNAKIELLSKYLKSG